jgi:hypothetical protein
MPFSFMPASTKVLAISKRLADLCGTQSLLYSAGLELVTTTNIRAARSTIHALGIRAVVVCRNSWSEAERESMISELQALRPELTVIMRCPGCTGCDEAASGAGCMLDQAPLTRLIAALNPPASANPD